LIHFYKRLKVVKVALSCALNYFLTSNFYPRDHGLVCSVRV